MNSGKARIKDIAQLAGVSIGTVDRVLHQRGEVAAGTKLRIERILKENNYKPNMMARVLKSKKPFHLVSLLPESTKENSFWEKHPAGMKKALEELDPFPVNLTQITFDMLNEKDFQRKTAVVSKLNPDGILLAPIFKSESIDYCSGLKKQRIPFVFVDGFIEKTDYLAYVGEDTFQSGRVAGQLTDMVTSDIKDILVVNIARNLQNIHHLNNRTNGFFDYFKDSGTNRGKKLIINIPDPSANSITAALDNAFSQNPGVGSVFFTGSKSHLIAKYLNDNGLKSVNLIGYDLLDQNVEFLRSGIIRFLIGQRPEEQTYKGIKKLFDYLYLNRIPEKTEYLPVDIITSENVDFFL